MSNFSSFLLSFCTSCILLGFLYMLCPSGSMSKSVKYVFCLCFLCSILACASGISKTGLIEFNVDIQPQAAVNEQLSATTAQSVFETALESSGIDFRKITVDTDKLQDGSIIISKVTVYTAADIESVIQAIGSDDYEVVVVGE